MENSTWNQCVTLTVNENNNLGEYDYAYDPPIITMEKDDTKLIVTLDDNTNKGLKICGYGKTSKIGSGDLPITIQGQARSVVSKVIDIPMLFVANDDCELTVVVCNEDKSIIIPCDPQVQN